MLMMERWTILIFRVKVKVIIKKYENYLVNMIEPTFSISNLAYMLPMVRGWTLLIFKVRGEVGKCLGVQRCYTLCSSCCLCLATSRKLLNHTGVQGHCRRKPQLGPYWFYMFSCRFWKMIVLTWINCFCVFSSVFEAFGKILSCKLEQDSTKNGKHK